MFGSNSGKYEPQIVADERKQIHRFPQITQIRNRTYKSYRTYRTYRTYVTYWTYCIICGNRWTLCVIFDRRYTLLAGAIGTAIKLPISLNPMPNYLASTMLTNRRQLLNCTLKAVERVLLIPHNDLK